MEEKQEIKEHCRKLFMTFIWVIMVQFASWMSMLDKGMARKEAQRAKRERMSVNMKGQQRRKRNIYKEKVSERDVRPPRCPAPHCSKMIWFLVGPLPASCLVL